MIIPMLCVTIFVILVVWFLLPRVARLMIHTPTAISIFVCLSMVQLMAVFISMRCTLCGHFLQVALTTLDAINNVFRKFSAFHDETGRLNVDGMNIISNDGSNKLNRSRKARVSYKVQRTINASLNAATSTRAVSSNPNFVTRQKI